MYSILATTLLLATSVSAQITTSIWVPVSLMVEDDQTLDGSIIATDGDRTTLAVGYGGNSAVYSWMSQTYTLDGSTYFEAAGTGYEQITGGDAYTYIESCSRARAGASATCGYSYDGENLHEAFCGDYSTTEAYTYVQTFTSDSLGPATVVTEIGTMDRADYAPEFCTEGTTIPEEYLTGTHIASPSEIATYTVVIAEGDETPRATTGASPSNTDASATPSGTDAEETGGGTSAKSGQSSQSGAPEDATGAAMPMVTATPALAGLGAAVAAAFL